jgi:2-C-methyl-D-erythritol 4-phosphate cytidylyltransferase/2-C-methyl-D-erythritol 2,4-cyclodiphosphate synthase
MFVSVIIAAGGRGTRLGADVPKQWLTLGGRTLLELSVRAFDAHARVDELVVVLPDGDRDREMPATKKPLRVVAGGERRQDSVANGFAAVAAGADVVLVHDAARPFVSAPVIDRTIAAAWDTGAAIAAMPVHDTVKQAESRAGRLVVAATLPRDAIYRAQTPQGFRREVLRAAIEAGRAGANGTDEAMLAEQAGHPVTLVEGAEENIKITTADDLARARAGLALGEGGGAPATRVGLGYDSHRFAEGRLLRLGGVALPGERGLAGHSDGDAVCHAVTDAVLGAAGLGDVGGLFPDTDPRWKDADSLALLRDAWRRVRDAGWRLGNLDIVVICHRPKLGPIATAIRGSLAAALEAEPTAVFIKGKTPEGTEGLTDTLVVQAIVSLTRAERTGSVSGTEA